MRSLIIGLLAASATSFQLARAPPTPRATSMVMCEAPAEAAPAPPPPKPKATGPTFWKGPSGLLKDGSAKTQEVVDRSPTTSLLAATWWKGPKVMQGKM